MNTRFIFIRLAMIAAMSCGIVLNINDVQAKKSASAMEDVALNQPFFSDKEKELIGDFFDILRGDQESKGSKGSKGSKNKKGLPPGLAKKKELPPGLAKQLEKNGTLPPGLSKRDLPRDLRSKLPSRKSIFERIIVGDDVLLIEKGTEIILDILRGAARN